MRAGLYSLILFPRLFPCPPLPPSPLPRDALFTGRFCLIHPAIQVYALMQASQVLAGELTGVYKLRRISSAPRPTGSLVRDRPQTAVRCAITASNRHNYASRVLFQVVANLHRQSLHPEKPRALAAGGERSWDNTDQGPLDKLPVR